MEINGNDPIDLTGLNKRDLRDIEHSLALERDKIEKEWGAEYVDEYIMNAIYRALIVCKKLNKEKYTPKKYKKPL